MIIDLVGLVLDKIEALTPVVAAEYFEVSVSTIRLWKGGSVLPSSASAQKVLNEYTASHPPVIWDVQKKVLILLPIYRSLNGKTHVTLFRNYSLYGRDKVGEIPKFRTLIWEARNQLAEMALTTATDTFIYCDDDMVLPCGHGPMLRGLGCNIAEPMASQVALTRLLSHDPSKLIVSALAFGRHEGALRAGCSDGQDSAASNAFLVDCQQRYRDELKPQRWVGMSFTRIHRQVFEQMKAEADKHFPDIKPSKPGRHYGFFRPFDQDQGEDSAFCLRAEKLGIKNYIDCGLPIGHCGEKVY